MNGPRQIILFLYFDVLENELRRSIVLYSCNVYLGEGANACSCDQIHPLYGYETWIFSI